MSKESILTETHGNHLYTLVASVQGNLDAFRMYMREKGITVHKICKSGVPVVYYAEYSTANQGNLAAMYFMRTKFGVLIGDYGVTVNTGPLLVVSGLEKAVIDNEAQQLIGKVGESEDPESVQFYIARLRQKAASRIL